MKHLLKTTAIGLLIGFSAGFATASEGDGPPVIEQVQLGDSLSDLMVVIPEHATHDAWAESSATGNAAEGTASSGRVAATVHQYTAGAVIAQTRVEGGSTTGTIDAKAIARGNRSTARSASGSTQYRADQVSDGYTGAATAVNVENAGNFSTMTSATANVSEHHSANGDNRGFQQQISNGSVFADTSVRACCINHATDISTEAGGNRMSASGSTTTLFAGAVQETAADTGIRGRTDAFIHFGGDVSARTTATGNSAMAENEFGYATLGRNGSEVYQGNRSDVKSETTLTLMNWSGRADVSASGVGNDASISNVGSDTALHTIQNNLGEVAAEATFNGGAGHSAVVGATAIGNTATATLCNFCGDAELHGSTVQTNYSSIQATTSVTQTKHGVHARATAIGNSATYQSFGD